MANRIGRGTTRVAMLGVFLMFFIAPLLMNPARKCLDYVGGASGYKMLKARVRSVGNVTHHSQLTSSQCDAVRADEAIQSMVRNHYKIVIIIILLFIVYFLSLLSPYLLDIPQSFDNLLFIFCCRFMNTHCWTHILFLSRSMVVSYTVISITGHTTTMTISMMMAMLNQM